MSAEAERQGNSESTDPEENQVASDKNERKKDAEGNDEAFDSLDDLIQKKQTENKLQAENNTARTQIFINSMEGGLNLGAGMRVESGKLSQKKYNLRNQEECTEFVETYKDGEYLALTLILCTFEAVVVGDLPELKSKILECLPVREEVTDETGEYQRDDPYLSLNTVLEVIGGQRFATADGQKCVGLGENSQDALINIMEQFPALRDAIVNWLLQISNSYRYRTTFDAYQIAMAFKRVISLDFRDAKKRIFPKLYSDPYNAELLGTVVYLLLHDDAEQGREAEGILMQWMKSDGEWLWKSASMSCFLLWENGCGLAYETKLKRMIQGRMRNLQWEDWNFMAELLQKSQSFRTMISEVFEAGYVEAENRNQQMEYARRYLELIQCCYYRVNSTFVELPLVTCDTKNQQECLAQIVKKVMEEYYLRRRLYIILEAYMKELCGYSVSEKVISHISAYFFNMARTGPEYRKDIMAFLKNCRNPVADRIYRRLCRTYEKGRIKSI